MSHSLARTQHDMALDTGTGEQRGSCSVQPVSGQSCISDAVGQADVAGSRDYNWVVGQRSQLERQPQHSRAQLILAAYPARKECCAKVVAAYGKLVHCNRRLVDEDAVRLVLLQVFIVDTRATKKQIKSAVGRLYDIQTKKINTLIRSVVFCCVNYVLLGHCDKDCAAFSHCVAQRCRQFMAAVLLRKKFIQLLSMLNERVFSWQARWPEEGVCQANPRL